MIMKVLGVLCLIAFLMATFFKPTPLKKKIAITAAAIASTQGAQGQEVAGTCEALAQASEHSGGWLVLIDMRLALGMVAGCLLLTFMIIRATTTVYIWICGRPFRCLGHSLPICEAAAPPPQAAVRPLWDVPSDRSAQTELDVAYLASENARLRQRVESEPERREPLQQELDGAIQDLLLSQHQNDTLEQEIGEKTAAITDLYGDVTTPLQADSELRAEVTELHAQLRARRAVPGLPEGQDPPPAAPPPQAVPANRPGEHGPAGALRQHLHAAGYPQDFHAERAAVMDYIRQTRLLHCGMFPMDLSGTNRLWIRAKCPGCRTLCLRYQSGCPR